MARRMFSVDDARSELRTVTVEVPGGSFDVEYRPGRISPSMYEALRMAAAEDVMSRLVDFLSAMVVRWDIGDRRVDESGAVVLDADGEEVWDEWPADREHAARLPVSVLEAIFEAMQKAVTPGEANAADSLDT